MRKVFYIKLIYIVILYLLLTACGKKEYEILKLDHQITDEGEYLQLKFEIEIANYSNEDYYYTLVLPSYLESARISDIEISHLPADSSTYSAPIITIHKDGPELSEETIESLKNGELPLIESILVGKMEHIK